MRNTATVIILLALLISCAPRVDFTDHSAEIEAKATALDLPWENLLYVEWVTDSQIAFLLKLDRQYFLGVEKYQHRLLDGGLAIFDLVDNSWEEIDTESFIDCEKYRVQFVFNLPNGTLGIGVHCYYGDTQGIFGRIYQYDLANKSGGLFYAFDQRMVLGQSAFLNGMDAWVQENNTNAGLGNELALVHIETGSTRLVEDFRRARSPVWLTRNTIAFFGTRTGPELQTLGQLAAFLDSPWTLYSLNLQTGELEVLLDAVVHGGQTKEVPFSNKLAFSGNINRLNGIWTFDLGTRELTRIWASNTKYSWSPDGDRLIVLDDLEDEFGYRNPRIIQMQSN